MKHAGPQALDVLEDLLAAVRQHGNLKEKKRGTFYCKSSGFLHFHEDPAGMFADLKTGDDYERLPVNTAGERRRFLARVKTELAKAAKG